ncbi:MAG: LURP-one-related/scramblase family protein [Halolamina sp.]
MADDYAIERIDLTDDRYTVEQGLIRNKFRALDAEGNVVLRGKQKMLKLKEQFPFVDGDDEEVFEVNAGSVLDVAGDYTLTDSGTGDDVVVLDNDYSLLQDTWKIRDADTEAKLAEINSRGALTTLARNLLPLGELIPHEYEITDADGDHVGDIEGHVSLRDRYEVTVDDASDVPTEPVVAAAMVIDAIQDH